MRVVVFNVMFYAVTFTTALVALAASATGGGSRRLWRIVGGYSRALLWMTRRVLRARIEIRGLERLPRELPDGRPALIVSKHQSELDGFLKLALYPDAAAVAMKELERYPLIGPVLRRLDYIVVSVDGPRRNQTADVIDGARRVNKAGRPILIYPEGELMRVGARERYRAGVFHIYEALGCHATPVALSTGLVWPKREWRKYVGQTCVMEVLDPIPPGLDRETFMAELERRIEGGSMALIREHGRPEIVAAAEQRHRDEWTNRDAPVARRPSRERTTAAQESADA